MSSANDMEVTSFQGVEYVDAAILWRHLPASLKSTSDKWTARLKTLKISPQSCRFTPTGNISELATSKAGRKSVYVPKHIWTSNTQRGTPSAAATLPGTRTESAQPPREVQQVPPEQGLEEATDEASTSDDASTSALAPESPPNDEVIAVSELTLAQDEMLVYEGVVLNVRVYGQRVPDKFFVDFNDFHKAIGLTQTREVPDSITVSKIVVEGQTISALAYDEMITLICLKANKNAVARELRKWMTAVIFAAQHGGAQDVPTQAEFASRDVAFRASTYFDDAHKTPINYIMDVCSVLDFDHEFPNKALPLVPAGRNVHDFRACKIGCGDGKDRPGSVRRELVQLIPGCDPRPVAIERFPEATREQLESTYESEMHEEFEEQRVRDIKLNGRQYTEVFILDLTMLEHARKKLGRLADEHRRKLLQDARQETQLAKDSLSAIVTQMNEIRSDLKVRDETMRNREETIRHLESTNKDKTDRTVQLEREVHSLKGALMSALPKKCADIMSGFLLANASA